jgi:hypothetical protein
VPRTARKIAAGEAVTVVAFGTSMTIRAHEGETACGYYLDALLSNVIEAYGNDRVELICRGLPGFSSFWGVHRVGVDVVANKPDLVLLEFAHNDTVVPAIQMAMPAIVAKIRDSLPDCEIASVILAPAGTARFGPSEPMLVHEAIAEYYGIPSFDLATLSEECVASGNATWSEGSKALTYDGVHHSPWAADVLGVPFARAFVELIDASLQLQERHLPASGSSELVRADRRSLRGIADAAWSIDAPAAAISFNPGAYLDVIACALREGASFQFDFTGKHVQLWTLLPGGELSVDVDGQAQTLDLQAKSSSSWELLVLAVDLSEARHRVTGRATRLPVVLGDLYFVGEEIHV